MLDVDKEVLVSRSIRKMLFRNQSFQRSHDLPSLKWGGRDDEKERQERGRTNHSYASVTIATVKHSPTCFNARAEWQVPFAIREVRP